MMRFKEFWVKKTLVGLGLGQFLSLLITSTGFSSSELAKKGINAPTSQSFLNYVLLAIVYGAIMLYRWKPLKAKWYYYVLLGMVDVEANFLVVKAYQYTSITSVMLLDYVHAGDRAGGSNPRLGDVLVIAGSTLYAISNVSEEFLVKNADRVELMAMLGFFGAIVSAIQISILERNELKSIHWSAGAALPFVGFSVAMFLFYSFVPVLLKTNGSTMLNLSLLTSDMWAVLIRIFAYHEKVDWMYFVAFAGVCVGLVIYSGGDKEEDQQRADVADEGAEQSKHFDEEAASVSRGTTAVGSSRTGDSSKHEIVPASTTEGEVSDNKSIGKYVQGRRS
ncbi:solute carrier family 35 member F1-like [Prunus yedoensis var. nudiflora]|uniref:Solute carrier family 35 member F1-like n=1 Tax=Prunus yedoensis var. nudiflora TaxID=2094558 RepID=A0A314Y093_PRUYE|nr:solute carrier family 35 member F1-like [Prunus yedoensis var. nudiflora]